MSWVIFTGHHRQKQVEREKEKQPPTLSDPGGRILMAPTTPTRYGPGPKPRFAPTRVQTSPRQFSQQLQSQSPRGVHPVSLTLASPQGRGASNVRHEPYPANRPRKGSLNFDPQSHTRLPKVPMKLPTEPGNVQKMNLNPNEVIKIEAVDEYDSQGDQTTATDQSGKTGESDMENGAPPSSQFQSSSASSSPSHTALPPTPTSQSVQSPLVKDDGSESSSSTIANEAAEVKYSDTIPPGGLSLDSDLSNLTGIPGHAAEMDTAEPKSVASDEQTMDEMDPNVNIKVEAITESELDLEITGVEPGQMPQSDNWMPNVQSRMGYGPSTSTAAEGDMSEGQGGAGYSKCQLSPFHLFPVSNLELVFGSFTASFILTLNFTGHLIPILLHALGDQKNHLIEMVLLITLKHVLIEK